MNFELDTIRALLVAAYTILTIIIVIKGFVRYNKKYPIILIIYILMAIFSWFAIIPYVLLKLSLWLSITLGIVGTIIVYYFINKRNKKYPGKQTFFPMVEK